MKHGEIIIAALGVIAGAVFFYAITAAVLSL